MRQQANWRGWLALTALMIVVLAACQPAMESDPVIEVTLDKQGDSADVQMEDGRAIIDVTSPSGIGGMQVTLESGEWPEEVVVHLRLQGLEQLEIGYDQFLISTGLSSNSSPGPGLMLYVTDESGEVESASPSSDIYYPTITPVTEGDTPVTIPLENGYFEIAMPSHFYEVAPESFTVQWIDFYR